MHRLTILYSKKYWHIQSPLRVKGFLAGSEPTCWLILPDQYKPMLSVTSSKQHRPQSECNHQISRLTDFCMVSQVKTKEMRYPWNEGAHDDCTTCDKWSPDLGQSPFKRQHVK